MIRLYFLICFCSLNWYFSNCYTMNSVLSRVRGCRTIRASHPNSGKLFNLQNFNSKAMNTALHEHETSSQEICSQIERSVLESMFEHNIGKSPTTCLLSVSGGSDSVAMMHILCAIKEGYKTKIDIEIVNFNHKARPESDEEVGQSITFLPHFAQYWIHDRLSLISGAIRRLLGRKVQSTISFNRAPGGAPRESWVPGDGAGLAAARMREVNSCSRHKEPSLHLHWTQQRRPE